MPEKKIKSAFERTLHLAWGGSRTTYGNEVLIDAPPGGNYFNGPALRDALLEAFPLEKAVKQYGSVVRPKPDFVPGTVVNASPSGRYVILPEGWYNIDHAITGTFKFTNSKATVVFDPRDAAALPSPLGIRVGDTVRRVTGEGDTDGDYRRWSEHTVEFTVNHIDGTTGYISPKYGLAYPTKGFEVTSREVPDRLPAGTITRGKCGTGLYLRTTDSWLDLSDGYVSEYTPDGLEGSVREGVHEVIYLP